MRLLLDPDSAVLFALYGAYPSKALQVCEITEALKSLSKETLNYSPPTLYSAIARLRANGMVESSTVTGRSGPAAKKHSLTKKGLSQRKAVAALLSRLMNGAG